MSDQRAKYLQILTLELNDLHSDLEMLVTSYATEKDAKKISNYVFMENIALLKNEILGVDVFHNVLKTIKIEHFQTVEDLICYVKTEFNNKMKEHGIAASLHRFVDKKLDKVEKFIKE